MEFFITANSIPVHVSDSKTGEIPLLLLHGYLETMYVWDELVTLLDSRYRVISIDLPGHGLTGSYDINSMEKVSALLVEILNKCEVDSAIVAGHSLGGYYALNMSRLYPDRVRKVVLLNSNPYADLPERHQDRLREIEIVKADRLVHLAMSSIPKMYNPDNLRRLDDKVQETIEICETHDPEGIVSTIKALMAREDVTEYTKTLKENLYMVFGDKDKFMPLEKAQELIALMPESNSFIIKDTGHNSFIEKPEEVAEIFKKIADSSAAL